MRRALELAENGRGTTHPNPLVGAVIVRDGQIVAEGWHTAFGEPHAEVEAIRAAGGPASCVGTDLYVTLEPCSHHGKTPPCTDAIREAGFKRVFVSVGDSNPLVNGEGKRLLEESGIEVREGILEKEGLALNRVYFHWRKTGCPFIRWKIAQTADGRMTFQKGTRTNITGPESWNWVRCERAKADAVLVGIETVLIDNPRLRALDDFGRQPYRVVFDSRLRIPLDSKLIAENADGRTIVCTSSDDEELVRRLKDRGVKVISARGRDGRVELEDALVRLAEMGILDILLESGRTLGNALLDDGFVNEVVLLQTGQIGTRTGTLKETDSLGADLKMTYEIVHE